MASIGLDPDLKALKIAPADGLNGVGEAGTGSAVLRGRIAALTRSLHERERTIDSLLRRLQDVPSDGDVLDPERVFPAACTFCSRLPELEEKSRALKETQLKLQNAEKFVSIGHLAAGIAHEINTPIQYVADNFTFLEGAFQSLLRGLERCQEAVQIADTVAVAEGGHITSKTLRSDELDFLRQDVPEAIEQSRDGLKRIASIVAAMKRFSHPSNDAIVPADLREIISTTILVSRNVWKYVADIETHFDDRLADVPCIRDDISQVLLNLIVNASQAIGDANKAKNADKGKIVVSACLLDDDRVEISVADSGPGIPEHLRARIFEPFFTTKPVGSGTGQGLALARASIVDRHHGDISFDSEVGKGTTFYIRLPMRSGSVE